MTDDLSQLLTHLLGLPVAQRADVAARLIDSLDPAFDEDAEAQWDQEIERRIARLDAGDARTIAWPELRQRLMGKIRGASAA